MMKRRGSGILLHLTSLPSKFGIGDLGPEAYKFADFLFEANQSYWQILPLNPTSIFLGNSPYSSPSAFAGNPLLISPEILVRDSFLSEYDLGDRPSLMNEEVDYETVTEFKVKILHKAYQNFKKKLEMDYRFDRFCDENSFWLDDYALFMALRKNFNETAWNKWPTDTRDRNEPALQKWRERLSEIIMREKFHQYLFYRQWLDLKDYCNDKRIQIIGDLPIYVNCDSSDVWTNSEIFKLDSDKSPEFLSGVPPDYFSDTGQLWGNPVYKWDFLRQSGYSWWIKRLEHNRKLIDIIRLDHFRGFVACWEVPAGDETAIDGSWVEVPADDFFKKLFARFPNLPIIAEDLGVITPDVREVMTKFELPGMKLLIFAFGEDCPDGPYLPHNFTKNCVVYTGTHDNNTVKGWFRIEASAEDKKRLFKYIGREVGEEEVSWEMIRLCMRSVANTVIVPMQDILGLGDEAKMNLPATSDGNWRWRLTPNQITPSLIERLKELTEIYGRS